MLAFMVGTKLYGQENNRLIVEFSVPKFFWNVKGSFGEIGYQIQLDPKDLGNSKITGSASIPSISTSNRKRDEHLQSEAWFNTTKYPKITISSSNIEPMGNQQYQGSFDITMKGISKKQVVLFKIIEQTEKKYLVANFTLSLKDYNIGSGTVSYVVGDKVKVSLNIPY